MIELERRAPETSIKIDLQRTTPEQNQRACESGRRAAQVASTACGTPAFFVPQLQV
jgi:hypothetical protein